MERTIIQVASFSVALDDLIAKHRLLIEDYEDLERRLVKNPQEGDVIPGLFGIRKVRLKSANKGKRAGFRVDYLDIPEVEKLYFLVIFSKNDKGDLLPNEKKLIGDFVKQLKKEAKK